MKQAFTLIELLVVVLIIGILSAVALPQYRKAIAKTRATEAVVNLRSIVNSMQVSKMANGGNPATSFDALSVQPAGTRISDTKYQTKNFSYTIGNFGTGTEKFEAIAWANYSTNDIDQFYIYYAYNGDMYCVAKKAAAKVPCSTVCLGNFITRADDGYYSCYIQ